MEYQMIGHLRTALVGGLFLLVLAVPAAVAYNGEVANQVDVSGGGQFLCPASRTLTATVVDLDGKPLEGVAVTWSTGTVTTTNAQGQASITVTVTATGVITASTAEAVGSVTLTCINPQGGVGGSIGLPRTDTAIPTVVSPSLVSWVLLFGVVAVAIVLVASAKGFSRVARRR
jgi:hypothetical protein